MRSRGAALPAALGLVLVAAVVTAGLTAITRTELRVAWHRRALAAALAAADTCLARVVASLPAGWGFPGVLAGPDGVAGTADDGQLVAPAGCAAIATAAPGGAIPPRMALAIDARADGGRRRLAAIVDRASAPGGGALVWVADPDRLGTVPGLLDLDGIDAADPTAPAEAALGAPTDPAALDAWLAAESGRVRTTPGTPDPVSAPPPPLADLVAAAQAAGAGPSLGAPALTLIPGDFTVTVAQSGAGVLVVDGVLDIAAPLDFAGVVAATRGLRVAPGAALAVHGSLWLGAAPSQPALDIAGTVRVTHDRAALAVADALLTLPRRATIAGIADEG